MHAVTQLWCGFNRYLPFCEQLVLPCISLSRYVPFLTSVENTPTTQRLLGHVESRQIALSATDTLIRHRVGLALSQGNENKGVSCMY